MADTLFERDAGRYDRSLVAGRVAMAALVPQIADGRLNVFGVVDGVAFALGEFAARGLDRERFVGVLADGFGQALSHAADGGTAEPKTEATDAAGR